jgi:uncharacterized protein YoxC
MQDFSRVRFDSLCGLCHTFRPMTQLAQVVLVLCAVVLTVAIVVTLASIRRAATRLETVLQLVEREIRPLASQVEGLTAEVRTLSQTANQELQRISGVIRRVELISFKIARVVGVANNLASFRGVTSVSSGLKRALGVFVSRLKA